MCIASVTSCIPRLPHTPSDHPQPTISYHIQTYRDKCRRIISMIPLYIKLLYELRRHYIAQS